MTDFNFNSIIRDRISGLDNDSEDLLKDITLSYSIERDYVTHIALLLSDGVAIIEKKVALENKLVTASDFIPIPELGKYKTESVENKVARFWLDDDGLAERVETIDAESLTAIGAEYIDVPMSASLPTEVTL